MRNLSGWRQEKNSLTLSAMEEICKKRKIAQPGSIVVKDAYWYTKKGAGAGGRAVIAKYGKIGGDEVYRKKKWREWWESEGKLHPSKITQPLPFKKPEFSQELAEFVGIMLGDGGMSDHQFTVTLNRVTDRGYFRFVEMLIKELFDVSVTFYMHKKSLAKRAVVSRVALVRYLVGVVGLHVGSKVRQQVDIPSWIKENRQYSISCLRGLIDTDGCIILHQYLSKGKRYCYKKIGFTSRSYPLLQSASAILLILGIKHRIMKNNWDIRIEAQEEVKKYFQVVGTHNPKHLKRYKMA
ncbi:MAG: LAGLIDADG family homing endonuclease [Candidatus Moranbacteria bacterium]|nr:LAGLIDADG family homing endonuclease [Candidatus Moranbacteria bacterium]